MLEQRVAGQRPAVLVFGLFRWGRFWRTAELARHIDDRNLGDVPAVVGAGGFELHHRNGVRWAAHNTQPTADALLLIDNHVRPGRPGARKLVLRIALHHCFQPVHTDAVVGADVHAARAEDTDRGVDHDVQRALQAAPRLGDRFLRAVAGLGLGKDAVALLQRQAGDDLIGNGLVIIDHAAPEIGEFDLNGLLWRDVLAAQIAIDRGSGIAPVGNRGDQVARALRIVTARKEARIAGHPGILIDSRNAPAIGFQIQFGRNERGIRILAESRQNGIALNLELGVRNADRAAASAGVRIAQLIAEHPDAAYMLAVLRQHFCRAGQIHEFDMLQGCLIYLVLIRPHLLFAAAVNDVDLLGTKAYRRAAAVHRGEATAQDNHALAHKDWLAKIDFLKERQAAHYAFQIVAGNELAFVVGHGIRLLAASSNIHSVVLLEQIGERDVFANSGIHHHLNAHICHVLVALFNGHIAGQAPDGDATNHHATCCWVAVVDGNGIAKQAQIAGASHARRTGADDGNLLIFGDGRRFGAVPIFAVVGGGALQPANCYLPAINLVTAANWLAGTCAGAAQHARDNIGVAVE